MLRSCSSNHHHIFICPTPRRIYPFAQISLFPFCSGKENSPKKFPGPKPLPLVGNLLSIKGGARGFLPFLNQCQEQYGDVYQCYFGWSKPIVVSDADMVEHVLSLTKGNGKNYVGRDTVPILLDVSRMWVKDTNVVTGLVFGEGDRYWVKPRKAASEGFLQKSFLQVATDTINKFAKQYTDHIYQQMEENEKKNECTLNVSNVNPKVFTDIISELAFGQSTNMLIGERSELAGDIKQTGTLINYFGQFPVAFWRYVPNKKFSQLQNVIKRSAQFLVPRVEQSVQKIKQQRSSTQTTNNGEDKGDVTFLDMLARLHVDGM
ncbi:cytochrome P450, family 2, subfamily K, polypeptide 6 [Reticulomyxa filosa]|uniref:Cytochrome P450, family 2, subfamily K, polypeptide 6 n=1 Tax=Reticulomyxa filosa TaxID=46433 RepID=X6NUK4_RETFI|nr:cytochrome P450, family 2, subfamily K, polypeptide 6 [Reticulomyxa filosa]|eukprot:ETO28932.1 cytochrome P450, family 2, subfamily K, polypeptide 6 [Reticulomyxa filosa]